MTYNIVLNNMSYLINKIKRAYARRKHQKPVTPVTGWYKLLIYIIISCDRQRHFARHSPSQPVTDIGIFLFYASFGSLRSLYADTSFLNFTRILPKYSFSDTPGGGVAFSAR